MVRVCVSFHADIADVGPCVSVLLDEKLVLGWGESGGAVFGGTFGGASAVFKFFEKRGSFRRFFREVDAYNCLRKLQGECIPRVLFAGFLRHGSLALVLSMEGRALSRSADQDARAAARRSLQRIHSYGVIHGDIRLPNFLLASEGRVLVADFGRSSLHDVNSPAFRDAMEKELRSAVRVLALPSL